MGNPIQDILASSVVLANESAALVRSIFKNGELGVIDKGGLKNYQTEADRAVQRLIITTLRHRVHKKASSSGNQRVML